MKTQKTTLMLIGALLLAMANPLAATSCDEDFCIDWWTIASGGEVKAESSDGQWRLSGTIGQWEATEARAASGGDWHLTGGFWGMTLEELADLLFSDRFEEEGS